MKQKENKYQKPLRPYISRDDKAILREKREEESDYPRVSDHHIDAA